MKPLVSHDRSLETDEEKSRWFQSLPLEERMALLVEFTELALQNRPELAEAPPALRSTDRIRVLRLKDVRALEAKGDKSK
ncbi:MAG: hypothetical protein NEA02_10120 [Thermoanaerobaculia bacterium]|nr:hypothetical protein [Thermoanaerobaculia bacterium]